MDASSGGWHVGRVPHQRWEVAPTPVIIPAAGRGGAVAHEQDGVDAASGDSRVGQAFTQRQRVTLTTSIPAADHGAAVAPEQDRVGASSADSRVGQAPDQHREVTLATSVPPMLARAFLPPAHGGAVAPEHDRVDAPSGDWP